MAERSEAPAVSARSVAALSRQPPIPRKIALGHLARLSDLAWIWDHYTHQQLEANFKQTTEDTEATERGGHEKTKATSIECFSDLRFDFSVSSVPSVLIATVFRSR